MNNKPFHRIYWNRQDYGYIDIVANSKEEALKKFNEGNYKDVDLYIKGGEITGELDSITY